MAEKNKTSVTQTEIRSPKNNKTSPTPELLNLIEIFNLTREYLLPDYNDIKNEEIQKLGNNYDAEMEYQAELDAIRKLTLQLENVPGLFKYLGFDGRKPEDINKNEDELDAFRFFYQVFVIHRSTLQSIIARLKTLRRNKTLPVKRALILTYIKGAMTIVLHPNNSIGLGTSPFELFAIDDQQRLKSCEMCNKIFWAYRLDAHTCSEKCANRRRQRNYRTKSKEK